MGQNRQIGHRTRTIAGAAALAMALIAVGACQAPAAPGGSSTTSSTTTAPSEQRRVDLQVLVLSSNDVGTGAMTAVLAREGVPTTVVDLDDPGRPRIDGDFLADTADGIRRSKFQAVVLANSTPALDPSELEALDATQDEFGIRRLASYSFPGPSVGLSSPTYAGPLDGMSGQLTAAATGGAWGYLDGAVDFDDIDPAVSESYGFLSSPLPDDPSQDSSFEPLLEVSTPGGDAGAVLGVHRADGREQLVITASMNGFQRQLLVLGRGIVDWLTGGVHLGARQNHLTVHADDVLLPNDRWSIEGNCTPGTDCPGGVDTPAIRMQEADAAALASWQDEQGFLIDLVHNGEGHQEIIEPPGGGPGAPDPLGSYLIANSERFRWVNHTWSHEYLGCEQDRSAIPWRCATAGGSVQWVDGELIEQQIRDNIEWSAAAGIELDPRVLVTGEHSGLRRTPQEPSDNPFLAPVLEQLDVGVVASDASREPRQRLLGDGSTTTLPRYPFNLFFNVATEQELVDEYNWIYNSAADGGSGLCTIDPRSTCIPPLDLEDGFDSYIRPLEARLASMRTLNGLPQPHYAHQSDLTEDRLLLDVVGDVLGWYRSTFSDETPLLNPTMWDAAQRLGWIQAWRDGLDAADPGASAYVIGDELFLQSSADGQVPLTLPLGSTSGGSPVGERYGSTSQTWSLLGAGDSLAVRLPAAPFRS